MAKNKHTFAKRQREIEKKRKADEKRARKLNKDQPVHDSKDVLALSGNE
jgi:hypothetical protein